jgi:colicin import membrane protein
MSATNNNSTGMDGSHYRVPPEPNRWPAIGLAVGVHAVLLAFLVVGINWTNNQPIAVEAEVWDTSVQQAAPPAPQPPQAEPEPEPETPPPTPRVAEPPPREEPAPPKQPDIALEREKKRKEELKRKEEERVERDRERELAQQKREQEKKEQALAEKKAREEAEKKELAKKEEAEKKKKEKAEKEKLAKAEAAKTQKLRDEELKRITSGAGNPTSSGTAAKSTAPRIDSGYIASIAAKIKGNTIYPGSTDVPGNPEVVFQVEQLPSGEILSVHKTKSSGIPAFDEAVERGINKSSPLPKKKDGTVERTVQVGFKLKEMN